MHACQVDGGAVPLDNLALVFRIRQLAARIGHDVGQTADVAERLEALACVGRRTAWRRHRRVPYEPFEHAP